MAVWNLFNIASLLVLLTHRQSLVAFVSADVFVCGSDYNDASKNCTVNTACPSGDGCPADKATCFSITEEKCLGPTVAPSEAPSLSPMLVCGFSYDDALTNCRSNDECLDGNCGNETHACFPIPVALCPTYAPSYSPTTIPKVCGVDSFDAQANCLDLSMRCPSGEGCPTGYACFSVPIDVCGIMKNPTMSPSIAMMIDSSVTPTVAMTNLTASPTATTNLTASPTATSTNQTMSPSGSITTTTTTSNPTTSPSTAMPSTLAPSASPIFSTFFCGETYELAEANCWTAEPCPSGSGCSKAGEDCFGISTDRCYSGAPTETPTGPGPRPSTSPSVTLAPSELPSSSVVPTKLPTLSPSASPIVNTYYCGTDYESASSQCASATPCPSGTCPGNMTCFGNILCTSPSPTLSSLTITSPAPSVPPQTTTAETGTAAPLAMLSTLSPSASPIVNTFYCGTDYESASSQCASATPCPSGTCPGNMICFGNIQCTSPSPTSSTLTITSPAPSVPPQTTTADTGSAAPASASGVSSSKPQPSVASSATEVPTMQKVDFDPNNAFYCGDDYNDAYMNCYKQVPCPSGAMEECPNGQSCFPIASCSTPSPAFSAGPTTIGLSTTLPPSGTILPSLNASATLAPTWDFSAFGSSGGSSGDRNDCSDMMSSFSVKSLLWIGVLLVGLV